MTLPLIPAMSDAEIEGDIVLLEMAHALHAGVRDEPFARMDFSDDQWSRLEAAAKVINSERVALISVVEEARGALTTLFNAAASLVNEAGSALSDTPREEAAECARGAMAELVPAFKDARDTLDRLRSLTGE